MMTFSHQKADKSCNAFILKAECCDVSPVMTSLLQSDDVTGPQSPSILYNAMISPLVGMTVRSALWYQGEANVGQGRDAYVCNLEALVQVQSQ